MIFQVTMKDTDVLQDAIDEQVRIDLAESGLEEDEQEALIEIRKEKATEIADNWFTYGEYLTVEIDTNKGTIRVLGANE